VDRVAIYWTPLVLLIAVGLLVIGGGVSNDWNDSLHKALVMLVLACPCALVIAAPIPAVCAIATAAKNKVLIRGTVA
jgi:Cd2+/Zn2+-exporting ATPase